MRGTNMSTIYILTITSEEYQYIMPFTTQQKAIDFVMNNFKNDSPRIVDSELLEGKNKTYVIDGMAVDQERF